MSTGITKNTTIVAVNVESTEGTYVAPAGASDGYIQPLQDGFEFTPSKESIQRNILTSSIGKVSPRVGMKSVAVTLPVEFRASGTEGTAPDFDILLKGAMGDSRSIASNITTKNSGNTGSVLQIEDGDIASLSVGDIIVVKETAGHHPCAITAKTTGTGTATITILPAKASGSFSNSVVLSKSKTYFPANSSQRFLHRFTGQIRSPIKQWVVRSLGWTFRISRLEK
jgi:hypothetical protein